jgi:CRP-like cAMP-binding protein
MYDLYFKELNKKALLTDSEQEQIKNLLSVKKIRKKQYLLQEGDVCKTIAFVEKGTLRSYTVDDNGVEHIVQFAIEGWFISDLYSFLTGEPATYNIDAIEDAELVLMSKSSHEELIKQCPKYESFIRELITGAYLAMQKRLTSVISFTLEERYEAFMKLYPEIAQRVPQHMVASYIGLTPETLSRVRKRIATNK